MRASSSITSSGGHDVTSNGNHRAASLSPSSPSPASEFSIISNSNSINNHASPKPTNITTTTASSDDSEHSRQNRRVCYIRLAMIATLVAATSVVAAFIGSYVSADERSNFELQYTDSVSKVAEGFQHRIDTKHDVAKTFSAMITSRYGNTVARARDTNEVCTTSSWPNVTMPDFQEMSEGSLHIAEGRALSFNPIITQGVDRDQWEAHAAETAWMMLDSSSSSSNVKRKYKRHKRLVEPDPDSEWPNNRTISFGIYSRDSDGNVIYDPGHATESKFEDVMVPVWQISPLETNEKAIMFNLHSEPNRQRALDDMMEYKVPVLTATLQLVQDAEVRPSSILFYPIFDSFRNSTKRNKVVGSVSIVFSWDTLLNKILPDYIKGMVCVLQSSAGQTFTYSISGDTVTLLGRGDRHDPTYDKYAHQVHATLSPLRGRLSMSRTTQRKFITYEMHMYPSAEFEAQYVTNRAGLYSAGAVLIFLFTSVLFLLYDYLVENRQKRMARMAQQTGRIVEGLFPARFRERLYDIHRGDDNGASTARRSGSTRRISANASSVSGGSVVCSEAAAAAARGSVSRASSTSEASADDRDGSSRTSVLSGGSKHRGSTLPSLSKPSLLSKTPLSVRRSTSTMGSAIRSVMGLKIALTQMDNHNPLTSDNPGHHRGSMAGGYFDDEPIAELFLDTSIMFSDIVGFTKWSSAHSPNQVFRLLERIFWEFDDIAARRDVFKLGTIGDCYIAVTGIPDPAYDHASLLARFALDARDKVREVCSALDGEAGFEGTAALDMRFGIHSGATVAGILRGTKSRFELFGDTINTASRMESTGVGGKIQVSEETAELIRRDGKGRWLRKREDVIEAKGKGRLQTYWVEPDDGDIVGRRVSFSERVSNFFMEDDLRSDSNKGCSSDSLHQHEYSSCGRRLSQWDEEEKLEEDDIEANSLDRHSASKDDVVDGNEDKSEEDDIEANSLDRHSASKDDVVDGNAVESKGATISGDDSA